MADITNPHDRFFKEVLTRGNTAKQFLENYLPHDVTKLLDLDSLEYTKDTFIDKHLKEYFSDLLLKTYLKDGSRGYVYILFEHKSYQEPLTAFHLLRYMVKIWEMSLKNGETPGFPVIIPLVFYHGEKRWRAGLNLKSLFNHPENMVSFMPDFQYLLWDASGYSDEEIRGSVVLRVTLLIMKYIFREDLSGHLPGILRLMKDLSKKQTGIEYIETVLKYLVNAAPTDNISYEEIKAAVNEALPNMGGEIMPTVADSLREQGIQQGILQGILQNAREAVIVNLEVRFETVPRSLVKVLNEINDPSILGMLHRKALTAKSLEDFRHIVDLTMK